MSWGISTIVLSPRELYLATKAVYYRCLPLLGIQRHIELPWQTLPEAYQGIGLPNFALLLLASKLQLIQCIWGFKDVASIALWMGYETFIMDIGMYGNPFSLNYELYFILATNMEHGSKMCENSSTNSRQLLRLAPTTISTLSN
jgi:hypothetical protein